MKGILSNYGDLYIQNNDFVITQDIEVLSNELYNFLNIRAAHIVNDIIIDPGFGFGKTLEDNYQLMRRLPDLSVFDLPILVGISRKSMIYRCLGLAPEESLNGTSVLNTISLMNGASILRVHDVREAKECVRLFDQYKKSGLCQ